MLQHVLIGDAGRPCSSLAVRGPLLVFMLPAPCSRRSRATAPCARCCASCCGPRVAFSALGREPRGLAHPVRSTTSRVRHPGLHDLEHGCWMLAGLLVWTLLDRPRLAEPPHRRRQRRARRGDVRRRAGAHGRARLQLPPALSRVPRRVRALGADRPAARRRRDDGRAAAHARDARHRAPADAAPAGAPARARRERDELLLRAALSSCSRSWRERCTTAPSGTSGPSALQAASFAAGLLLIAASLNSPLETIAAHRLLLAHLLQNALIADIAPPLLLLGLTPAMRQAIARRGGRLLAHADARPRRAARVARRLVRRRISPASTTGRSRPAGRSTSSTGSSFSPGCSSGGRS